MEMNKKIELAQQIASEFNEQIITVEEAEQRFNALHFIEEDNASKLVKAHFEMALAAIRKGEFSDEELEILFDTIWFFWDYSSSSTEDVERHSIMHTLSSISRMFNLRRYYKNPDTVENLYAIKVKKYGWMKFDGTDLSEPDQMKRIHSILKNILGNLFIGSVKSYNIDD